MTKTDWVWAELFRIESPWTIAQVVVSSERLEIHLTIQLETPRVWGIGRRKRIPVTEMRWRHINIGKWKVLVAAAVPLGMNLVHCGWAGAPDMPFSRDMEHEIFSLFNEGVSLQSICQMLDLNLSDLWRYRYALDTGKSGISVKTQTPRPRQSSTADPAAMVLEEQAEPTDTIPDVSDPMWLELVQGDRQLEIKVLSLKLMLSRIQTQFQMITDDQVRILKLKELHRYFVKNERMLQHELSQLKSA